jgi:hypothetical protein
VNQKIMHTYYSCVTLKKFRHYPSLVGIASDYIIGGRNERLEINVTFYGKFLPGFISDVLLAYS